MIKCNNCGAELADGIVICPFCKSESIELATKEHTDQMQMLQEEIHSVKEQTLQKQQKIEKTILGIRMSATKAAILFLAAVAILLLFVFIGKLLGNKSRESANERHLKQLEEYYEAGDYQKVAAYYSDLDYEYKYGALYRRYARVSQLEALYKDVRAGVRENSLDWALEGEDNEALALALSHACYYVYSLHIIQEGPILAGEDAVIAQYEDAILSHIQDNTGMTLEEIQKGVELSGNSIVSDPMKDPEWLEFAAKVRAHLEEE